MKVYILRNYTHITLLVDYPKNNLTVSLKRNSTVCRERKTVRRAVKIKIKIGTIIISWRFISRLARDPRVLEDLIVLMKYLSGPGGRRAKSATGPAASHRSDDQHDLDNIRRLLLSAGSPRDPRALRSLVLPGALLQHGHVLLRSWQVNI